MLCTTNSANNGWRREFHRELGNERAEQLPSAKLCGLLNGNAQRLRSAIMQLVFFLISNISTTTVAKGVHINEAAFSVAAHTRCVKKNLRLRLMLASNETSHDEPRRGTQSGVG